MKIYKNFISKIARMLKRKILNIFLLISVNKIYEYLLKENWILKLYHEDIDIYHYYLHLLYIDRLHKNDDDHLNYIHVTLNLNMLLYAIISFFIFYILYKYNIQIISEKFIEYLQYNLLFVLDSILIIILYLYDYLLNKKKILKKNIKEERIENFIYYPYIIMIIIWMSLKRSKKLKFELMLFIKDYMLILDIPYPMINSRLEEERELKDNIKIEILDNSILKKKKEKNKKEKKND